MLPGLQTCIMITFILVNVVCTWTAPPVHACVRAWVRECVCACMHKCVRDLHRLVVTTKIGYITNYVIINITN